MYYYLYTHMHDTMIPSFTEHNNKTNLVAVDFHIIGIHTRTTRSRLVYCFSYNLERLALNVEALPRPGTWTPRSA